MLVLKIQLGDEFIRDFRLKLPEVTVGSGQGCTLRMAGEGVIDRHMRLVDIGGIYHVEPCAAEAGISLNGVQRAAGMAAIHAGDTICFACYKAHVLDAAEDSNDPDAPDKQSSGYYLRSRVLKELQIPDAVLDRLVLSGDLTVHHYHGSEVYDKSQVTSLRDRIQAHTTRKMERLDAGGPGTMLGFNEVMAILGLESAVLNEYVSSGRIRAFRTEDEVRFRSEDVSALLKRGVDAPAPDGVAAMIDDVSTGALLDTSAAEMDLEDEETAETDDRPCREAAGAAQETAPEKPRATSLSVHYFRRMSHMRNFPIYIQGRCRLPLRVSPAFPGCLCVPAEAEIGPASNKVEMWVTPLSVGPCPAPAVNVYSGGRLAGSIPVPFTCARQWPALALLAASPAWILIGLIVDMIPARPQNPPPLLQRVLSGFNGALGLGIGLFVITVAFGVLLHFLSRPAEASVLTAKIDA